MAKKQSSKTDSTAARKPAASAIDRDKLRAAIRQLDDEYVFYMLDDAIDLLQPAKLAKKRAVQPSTTPHDGTHHRPHRSL
jgi:hypothetical protein